MEADLLYYHQHDTDVPTDTRRVALCNAREGHWDLDTNGFQLVPSFPPLVPEEVVALAFDDPTGFAASIFPLAEAFLRDELPGAKKVICFDHILRNGAQYKQEQSSGDTGTKFLSPPIPAVHNDYSVRSGRVRIEALLDPFVDDKAVLASVVRDARVSIVNMWCPLDTVDRDPLAMCDWQSTQPSDVTTVKIKYSTRTGETIRGKHSPRHRWAYYPRMERGECVLLKTWDSAPSSALEPGGAGGGGGAGPGGGPGGGPPAQREAPGQEPEGGSKTTRPGRASPFTRPPLSAGATYRRAWHQTRGRARA
jgi:hypothetical protein